jgi:hypothetical protein
MVIKFLILIKLKFKRLLINILILLVFLSISCCLKPSIKNETDSLSEKLSTDSTLVILIGINSYEIFSKSSDNPLPLNFAEGSVDSISNLIYGSRIKILTFKGAFGNIQNIASTLTNNSHDNYFPWKSIIVYFAGYGIELNQENLRFPEYSFMPEIQNSIQCNKTKEKYYLLFHSFNLTESEIFIPIRTFMRLLFSLNSKQFIIIINGSFAGNNIPDRIDPFDFYCQNTSDISTFIHILPWHNGKTPDSICTFSLIDAFREINSQDLKKGSNIFDAFQFSQNINRYANQIVNNYGEKFRSLNIFDASSIIEVK